jgi:Dyp-type peroxidase family
MPHTQRLEKAHIQNIVANGYDFHHSRYCVLSITQVDAARQFLRALLDGGWVVSATASRAAAARLKAEHRCPVGIGFTFKGLQQLQLPSVYLRAFQDRAPAFAEGAYRRAAHRLADTGPSAAELWEASFRPHTTHLLLTLHADTVAELDQAQATLQQLAGDAFAPEGWTAAFQGSHLNHDRKKRRIHFGYLDGITNPLVNGLHAHAAHYAELKIAPQFHAPGEFLLGHDNDEGYNRWLLSSEDEPVRQFFANGSFSVFRKMAQDTAAFESFVDKAASDAPSADYVRAKLLGRWHDGRVLDATSPNQPGPDHTPQTNAELNDFDFSADKQGLGCPFGAHIRRMNPRADPVVPFRRRPLLRRGIPYGPAGGGADSDRGLLGLFFCASLEDQFEHLVSEWGNKNPFGTGIQGTAKDPLIGNHEGDGGQYDIPVAGGVNKPLTGFTPFVTTRGTLYTMFPSLPALRVLAGLPTA